MKKLEKLKVWLVKVYGIRWVQVATVVFVVVFYFYNRGVLQKSKKEPINFYTKGNLMWLIDTTRMNTEYTLLSKEFYRNKKSRNLKYSYENYLDHINSHKEYTYKDWRLPTEDEMLSLELSNNWFIRPFISDERVKNEINIDTKIFYDHRPRNITIYWTNSECIQDDGSKGHLSIGYNTQRFYTFSRGYGRAHVRGGSGDAIVKCRHKGTSLSLRLVRDR